MSNATYAIPKAVVSTAWVNEHLNDPAVCLVEVDVDTTCYQSGHIPGAVGWNWKTQLCDTVKRDIISKEELEKLMRQSGITNDSKVILYGDNKNWFAAWAFWQLKIYGHEDVCIMNGGRKKWLAEGRTLTTAASPRQFTNYQAKEANEMLRAFLPEVQQTLHHDGFALVDVRSPAEFSGEILAPPGLPETCQRGGHIPNAKNIPWSKACHDDGTFKSKSELQQLYGNLGVTADKKVITYCRIGERSSHSWFVLKYLLGYPHVSNYDGSWTEWGNLVGVPVERGN